MDKYTLYLLCSISLSASSLNRMNATLITGTFPPCQACHTWDESIEETRADVKDAMSAYLRALRADEDVIPEDKGLELFETIEVEPQTKSQPLAYA